MKVTFKHRKFRSSKKFLFYSEKIRRDSGKRKKKAEILKDIPLKSWKIN